MYLINLQSAVYDSEFKTRLIVSRNQGQPCNPLSHRKLKLIKPALLKLDQCLV